MHTDVDGPRFSPAGFPELGKRGKRKKRSRNENCGLQWLKRKKERKI